MQGPAHEAIFVMVHHRTRRRVGTLDVNGYVREFERGIQTRVDERTRPHQTQMEEREQ
jgi:hypothetical protein